MIGFEEARRRIVGKVAPTGVEHVQVIDAGGRIAAFDFSAPWEMPRFDHAAMDGFAVRSADCPATPLRIIGYLPAGSKAEITITAGCAARIMTGAPMPAGADAVVPLEGCDWDASTVTPRGPVAKGDHVRFRGKDVASGEPVVVAGTLLGPPHVGILASFNCATVPVYRRPRVAIVATGDELVELGTEPKTSELINSNSFMLAAAVNMCGAEAVILGIARDDRESHLALLSAGLKADALITSAGVSAGDRDLVRATLAELGVVEEFWKVAVKPGGPTAFGMKGAVPVFSLPGTPSATMIAFEMFVRPALLKMLGHAKVFRKTVRGVLTESVRKKTNVVKLLGVRVAVHDGRYAASLCGAAQTGMAKTMQQANALALLAAEGNECNAGDEVALLILDPTLEMEA